MAIPKVFVSSTCFDLKEVRDSLSRFIKSFGFDPVLSEHGDVFYHPDLHTHEACIHEVANCQLFILIIGGRFGGTYTHDKEKSITNAEYDAARESNIPVFTYIKKGVYDNHNTFQANKSKDFINDMDFPNIDKQEHAKDIFTFIDQVRKSKTNNAFETFEVNNDIEVHLRKQWAGMFFDFLKNREVKEQVNAANKMLSVLQTSSEKLEDMLKGLYQTEGNKENTLNNIEHKYTAIKFFDYLLSDSLVGKCYLSEEEELDRLVDIEPKEYSWVDYLVNLGAFKLVESEKETRLEFIGIGSEWALILNKKSNENYTNSYLTECENNYKNGVQKLNKNEREELLTKYVK